MSPLFSVVIPTFNRASNLKRAIESVLVQSYDIFEILVMDDGSTDNTAEIVASFADQRITYRWDKNFGGPARPRNRGITLAKGEWIAFLDADDWWTADKLQVCFDCINDKVDLVYHDLEIVSDHPKLFSRKINKSRQVKPPVFMDLLLKGNAISNSSVVVRKRLLERIGSINESAGMIASEDYNTWLRIAQITDRFLYIPQSCGFYLDHNQNLSKKDMSIPAQNSVAEFIHLLDEKQNIKLQTGLIYTKGRFNYLSGNYAESKKNLLLCFYRGKTELKAKSIFMLAAMAWIKLCR
jgi:glycosyltransferase involved in cell wall biosynthesis